MNIRSLLTIACLSIASAAFAQAQTPRVDQREAHQQQRIEQGTASGALTPKETARMENGQARVNTAEANAKADGQVTHQERRKLHLMQDKQSAKIYRNKHDKQVVKPAA